MSAVTTDARQLFGLLARDIRHGELVRRVREIEPDRFATLLERVTEETRQLVTMVELAQSQTFDSMLAQVLDAFALKVGELMHATRTRVYLVDEATRELFSLGASHEDPHGEVAEELREIRVPSGAAIAGAVAASGETVRLDDVSAHPAFTPALDLGAPGGRLLVVPLADSQAAVFAVLELEHSAAAAPFRADDEARLGTLVHSLATVLESWFRMSCRCRAERGLVAKGCCAEPHAPGTPCP
jgi:adenylate cyclase